MNFLCYPGKYNLIVSFTLEEGNWCLPLIDMAMAEEKERGTLLPTPDELILHQNTEFPHDYFLDFSFKHLSVARAVLMMMYESDDIPCDLFEMEEALIKVSQLCGDSRVLH